MNSAVDTVQINARLNRALRDEGESALASIGLSPSEQRNVEPTCKRCNRCLQTSLSWTRNALESSKHSTGHDVKSLKPCATWELTAIPHGPIS